MRAGNREGPAIRCRQAVLEVLGHPVVTVNRAGLDHLSSVSDRIAQAHESFLDRAQRGSRDELALEEGVVHHEVIVPYPAGNGHRDRRLP